MRLGMVSLLIFSLIHVVFSRNEFPNEVVVTSADLVNGKIENIGKAGESYRLYAIFAGYINNDDSLTKQITITDSIGTMYRLSEFHSQTKPEVSYFLSDQRIVIGPLTVRDPTPSPMQKSVPSRLPYTIYIASTKVEPLPVADAVEWSSRMTLNSDSYNGQEVKGVTILSADAFFTLRQFNITADSAFIIPRGYDLLSSGAQDSIMLLDRSSNDYTKSQVTIFGPIATIVNLFPSQKGRLQMTYDVASSSWGGFSAGGELTLLSPNWLSLDDAYSTTWRSYGNEAFDRQFELGRDTFLDFTISASSLKTGESVTVEIEKANGDTKQWNYGPSNRGEMRDTYYGTTLRLTAKVADISTPSTYPRFMVTVTSDASTSSAIISLMLTVFYLFQ